MATERYHLCTQCRNRTNTKDLFGTLRQFVKSPLECEACKQTLELRLGFGFGLNAGRRLCKVLDAFLPVDCPSWSSERGGQVTFFPFLVVLEYLEDMQGRGFWLPYWHVDQLGESVKTKYGQWAPFMDDYLFESLISQARAKGHLLPNLGLAKATQI
jgi:hypothetical protein